MPSVLVVDDNAIDRVLIEGVLKKDARMKVRSAVNGAEALAQIADHEPDLIVTDLQMPEMDGLELVTAVCLRHPQVPIILITAHGSEELAVQALEQGAASYVPKSQVAANLLGTVDQVLELAKGNRGYEALAQAMDYAEFRFRLENDFLAADRLVELGQQLAGSMGVCNMGEQVRLGIALEEALRLAVMRGNLELSQEVMFALAADRERALAVLEERRQKPPFSSRRVLVHMRITPEEASYSIAHDGPPLKIFASDGESKGPELEDLTDRSLVLMRTFMDELIAGVDGTSMRLIKRRSSS